MRAVAVGVGLGFAVGWNIANVGALAQPLADAYDIRLATVGLLTTALFVVHMAMQVPAGVVVDRFGAREAGILAAAVVAAANGLALVAPDFGVGLAARALAGAGTGLGFVAGADYVRAAGGSATAQGLYGGAAVGGGGFSLAVVPPLANTVGWRAPYRSAVVLALAVVVALALAPRAARLTAGARAGLRTVLGDRVLYRLAAIHAASFGLSTVAANWVVTLLERAGATSEAAGALGAFTLAAGLVTRPLGGWLVRRCPAQARVIVGWSLAAGAAATGVLALPAPLAVLGLACAVLGLAAGFSFAPAFAGAQRARPDAPAAAIGLVNGWAALTIVVGTPLVGLTFALPGDGRLGFAVVAAAWGASLLLLPPRRVLAG